LPEARGTTLVRPQQAARGRELVATTAAREAAVGFLRKETLRDGR
jgi:hypothetical protein